MMDMKNKLIIGGSILLLVIIYFNRFDKAVNLKQDYIASWGNVQANYQRRTDLIPNLVSGVKAMAESEKETFAAVMEARSKATSLNIDASNMSAEGIAEYMKHQGAITSGLGRLMVSVERYPDLKQSQGFMKFFAGIEGCENRISVSRIRYNESVNLYNKYVKSAWLRTVFRLVLVIDDHEEMPVFEAAEGSDVVPTANF
jgi:LemA protein